MEGLVITFFDILALFYFFKMTLGFLKDKRF